MELNPTTATISNGQGGRKGSRKSRGGCRNCKARRVKCDETKPACLRCSRSRLECGYVTTSIIPVIPVKRILLPKDSSPFVNQPSKIIFEDDTQYQYFRAFCNETAVQLSGYFDVELWNRIIPQACLQEPLIRHGAIAMAALALTTKKAKLRDQAGLPLTQEAKTHYEFALQHYGKAISSLRQSISTDTRDIRLTLMACIIIVCFETYHGNIPAAIAQVQTGRDLLAEWRGSRGIPVEDQTTTSSKVPGTIEDEIIQTFGRLNIQAMTIANPGTVSYHHGMLDYGESCIMAMPLQFQSLKEARIYLDLITQRFMHFVAWAKAVVNDSAEPGSFIVSSINLQSQVKQQARIKYHTEISRWHTAFQPLLYTSRTNNDARERLGAGIIQLHYLTTYMTIASATGRSGRRHLMPQYREIVSVSTMLLDHIYTSKQGDAIFNFDLQVIILLSTVALRCPHRGLRRKAILLLVSPPRQNSVHDSIVFGQIALWVSGVEEEGLKGEYIPDKSRVFDLEVGADIQARKATIRCKKPNKDMESGYELREISFAW